jgi:hypothetical protein
MDTIAGGRVERLRIPFLHLRVYLSESPMASSGPSEDAIFSEDVFANLLQ